MILVDGYFLRTERGVGLHTLNFLMELDHSERALRKEIIVLVPADIKYNLKFKNLIVKRFTLSLNIFVWYNLIFPFYAFKLGAKKSIFPANLSPLIPIRGRRYVTIHDIMFLTSSFKLNSGLNWFQFFGRIYLSLTFFVQIIFVHKIITMSRYSRDQISTFVNLHKIAVVYQGPGQILGGPLSKMEEKNKRRNIILCYGSDEKRKNTAAAIRSFTLSGLAKDGFVLVVIGSPKGVVSSPVEGIQVKDNLSQKKISDLIHRSCCFLFLSIEEGFGLPIVEFSLAGVPVICSKAGAMFEVGDGIAYFADVRDELSISQVMRRVCIEQLRPKSSYESIQKEFNWKKYTSEYLRVIGECDE